MIKKEKMLSDGTYSTAPKLGWIKLIDEKGEVHDSRKYGTLETTPRASFSSMTGEMIQLPNRSEPYFVQNEMRQAKQIEVTICVTDERDSENVLRAFCRGGKLVVSTHPNLYYKVHVADSVRSEPLSRRFSKITVTYLASAFRYVLNESAIDAKIETTDGVIAEGTAKVTSKYPISEEECEPKIYIQTQGGALAETLYAEISADFGETFRAENLAPDTIYCIDSELLTFYKCGIITNGEFSAMKFVDMTGKTSGDFPILKAQHSHSISYKGYIKRMWVNLNRRFNV